MISGTEWVRVRGSTCWSVLYNAYGHRLMLNGEGLVRLPWFGVEFTTTKFGRRHATH